MSYVRHKIPQDKSNTYQHAFLRPLCRPEHIHNALLVCKAEPQPRDRTMLKEAYFSWTCSAHCRGRDQRPWILMHEIKACQVLDSCHVLLGDVPDCHPPSRYLIDVNGVHLGTVNCCSSSWRLLFLDSRLISRLFDVLLRHCDIPCKSEIKLMQAATSDAAKR